MSSLPSSATLPHPLEPCSDCEPAPLADGSPSGCWRCGQVLLRRLSSKRGHLLKKPPGIAFNVDFWQAQRPGLRWLVVVDVDTSRGWVVSAEGFERRSVLISRGHGPQCALPLRYWHELGTDRTRQEGRQLALTLEATP